jgi:hypothetical protein
MGWEPDENQLPIDPSTLSDNCQYALLLLNALPDRWDGMSGSWFGKDYSGLSAILDIYEIENRKEVFKLLQIAETELGKHYEQKRKEQESMSKAKRAR